jgi:hypothetical protein
MLGVATVSGDDLSRSGAPAAAAAEAPAAPSPGTAAPAPDSRLTNAAIFTDELYESEQPERLHWLGRRRLHDVGA